MRLKTTMLQNQPKKRNDKQRKQKHDSFGDVDIRLSSWWQLDCVIPPVLDLIVGYLEMFVVMCE